MDQRDELDAYLDGLEYGDDVLYAIHEAGIQMRKAGMDSEVIVELLSGVCEAIESELGG